MYMIFCDRCGWYEEKDFVATTSCPNCGSALIIENDADDDSVADMIDTGMKYVSKKEHISNSRCIENMERSLKKLGHKRTWDIIEDMPNAYNRAYYRNIFKKAGGRR